MNLLKKILDAAKENFIKDGKPTRLYFLYEAFDSFVMTPSDVTKGKVHVRDGLDFKRMMSIVVFAALPCMIFGMYNTGFQANTLLSLNGMEAAGFRGMILSLIGCGVDPDCVWGSIIHGALYFIPIYLVTNIAGGFWEILFAVVRKHEINEGFFVTGFLFALIVPATIPLWQVAIAISFAVLVGKEVFGGTGKNFLNPALVARAFLFFAYPGEISGDAVWTAVDGHTGATALSKLTSMGVGNLDVSWFDAFLGLMPGSFGETSALLCIVGAIILIVTGIGSWRIILSIIVGTALFSLLLNVIGSSTNTMFAVPAHWHMVLGGFAFGAVFMATDPVSAAQTFKGQYIYGLLIGLMVVLIRVINPAFPEGMMLAIIFGNIFAPLIDYFVVNSHIKKREKRYAK